MSDLPETPSQCEGTCAAEASATSTACGIALWRRPWQNLDFMSFSQELVAVRTTPTGPRGLENVPAFFEVARLDPNAPGQIGICDSLGVFRLGALSVQEHRIIIQASFYLQHWEGGQLRDLPQIPWLGFDFLSARPGEILFSQSGGNQLLFFKLPLDSSQLMSQIFLFGVHRAPVSSFLVNSSGVLVVSGSQDGAIKLWDVTSGDLLDHNPNAHSGSPTCMHFMGPFMVVIGWSDGLFGLWDITSSRLIQTNKISMGPHSISCISTYVPDDILSRVSTARGLSRPSTGGGILSEIPKLPGRQYSGRDDTRKPRYLGTSTTMIAVGCEDGMVAVWAPSQTKNQWEISFSVPRREHHIPIKVAFARSGSLLQIVSGVGDTSVVFSHDTTSGEMLSGQSTHGIPTLCEFIDQSPNLSNPHPFGPCPAHPTSKTVMVAVLKFGTPSVVVFPLPSLDKDRQGQNAGRCSMLDSGDGLGIGGGPGSEQNGELHTVSLRAGLEDRLMRMETLSLKNMDDSGSGLGPRATDHSNEEGSSGSDDEDMVFPEPRVTPANLIPIPQSSIREVKSVNPKSTANTNQVVAQGSKPHIETGGSVEASHDSGCEPIQSNPCTSTHQEFPYTSQTTKAKAKIASRQASPALHHQTTTIGKDLKLAMPNRIPRSAPMQARESCEQSFPPISVPTEKTPQVAFESQPPSQSFVSEGDPSTQSQTRWKVQRHKHITMPSGDPMLQTVLQQGCLLDGQVLEPQSDMHCPSMTNGDGNGNCRSMHQLSEGCPSPRSDEQNYLESKDSPCRMSQGGISETFGNEGNDENRPPFGNGSTFGAEEKGDFSQPVLQSTNMVANKLERCRNEEFDSNRMLGQDSVRKRIVKQAAKGGNVPRNAKIFDELKPIEPEVAPRVKRLVRKQLHPKWVAGRSRKPQMSDLWNPEDHQIEVCDTAPVHVPVKFSLRRLAKSLSRIPLEVKQRSHIPSDRH